MAVQALLVLGGLRPIHTFDQILVVRRNSVGFYLGPVTGASIWRVTLDQVDRVHSVDRSEVFPCCETFLPKKLGGHDYNINLLEKSGGGAQFLEVNLTHS